MLKVRGEDSVINQKKTSEPATEALVSFISRLRIGRVERSERPLRGMGNNKTRQRGERESERKRRGDHCTVNKIPRREKEISIARL